MPVKSKDAPRSDKCRNGRFRWKEGEGSRAFCPLVCAIRLLLDGLRTPLGSGLASLKHSVNRQRRSYVLFCTLNVTLSKVFYKKDNMCKLLNWDRDAESGAWRGQDMTHAESHTILPLFRFKGDESSRCSTVCRQKDSHFMLFWVNFCPRVSSLCSPL